MIAKIFLIQYYSVDAKLYFVAVTHNLLRIGDMYVQEPT